MSKQKQVDMSGTMDKISGDEPKDQETLVVEEETPKEEPKEDPSPLPPPVVETYVRPVVKMLDSDYHRIKMICLKNKWKIGEKLRDVLMEWVESEENP